MRLVRGVRVDYPLQPGDVIAEWALCFWRARVRFSVIRYLGADAKPHWRLKYSAF